MNVRKLNVLALCVAAFLFFAVPCCASEKDAAACGEGKASRFAIETARVNLSGSIGGKTVDYTVTAGLTPILDETGEEVGQIFSTAYVADAAGEQRPVAFIFNGGPGSASIYLHVGAFAPKTVRGIGHDGIGEPAHPYQLADNPESPLGAADLVFIDPVGTGFSRSVGKKESGDKGESEGGADVPLSPRDPSANERFWSAEDDLASLAEFVRVWLSENKRWGSQIFLVGESYGGFRAAGLPYYLSKAGGATSGTAMISPAISYKDLTQTTADFEADIEVLPTAAAIARYHGLLAPGLQEISEAALTEQVWKWARTEYRAALHEGGKLSGDRFDAAVKELSRFTSLPEIEFKSRGLRFPAYEFSYLVLRERRLVTSPYDGRLTAPASYFIDYGSEDPASLITNEYYNTALMNFLYGTVGLTTLRPYLALNEATSGNWRFDKAGGGNGFADTGGLLAVQMRRIPSLKVFVAMGRYDTVCPPESVTAALDRLDIPPDRAANIETHLYDGGHMMYINPGAARKLCEDLSKWIEGTAGGN